MSDEQRKDEDVEGHVRSDAVAAEPADGDEDDEVAAHMRMNVRLGSARHE